MSMLSLDKGKVTGELLVARAEELFSQGLNCCESMIKASIEVLELPLPEETYRMGKFFRLGVAGTGCICGALAGGIMVLGYLSGEDQNKAGLAKKLVNRFSIQFESTCCRIIRKNMTLKERYRNKKCREITGFAAAILEEIITNDLVIKE